MHVKLQQRHTESQAIFICPPIAAVPFLKGIEAINFTLSKYEISTKFISSGPFHQLCLPGPNSTTNYEYYYKDIKIGELVYQARRHSKFLKGKFYNLGWYCVVKFSICNFQKSLTWTQYKTQRGYYGYIRVRNHTPKFKKWILKFTKQIKDQLNEFETVEVQEVMLS